jgi:hypothetical protein
MDNFLNAINSLKTKAGESIETNKKLKDAINELYSLYGGFKKQIDKIFLDVISFFIRRNL